VVVCHGRGLSSGLGPAIVYIFYDRIIMVDVDKIESTQTCVILVIEHTTTTK